MSNLRQKRYYQRNRERILKRTKEYNKRNKEKIRDYARMRYLKLTKTQKYKEKLEKQKEYYKNPEVKQRRNEYMKQYRKRNYVREKHNVYMLDYYHKNKTWLRPKQNEYKRVGVYGHCKYNDKKPFTRYYNICLSFD